MPRLRSRLLLALAWLLLGITGASATPGFRTATIETPERPHPLTLAIWYPAADDGTPRLVGDNPVFQGVAVREAATPLSGRHPLVVLSHGFGGNRFNQAWLAVQLADAGYVVAATDHPGTSTFDRDPDQAAALWRRPADLSRVIDHLTGAADLSAMVDPARIAVIGHSLGGWTAVEIAGGRFDADAFTRNCAQATSIACTILARIGRLPDPDWRSHMAADLADPRVSAVIALDPGGIGGFTQASLKGITIPVLVIAAGIDRIHLPAETEARRLAGLLPDRSADFHELPDAAHFSFIGLCKPGAAAILDREQPGDGILCRDGDGRDRPALHAETTTLVVEALKTVWPR
ncbi:alpha/beta fold hydrolase [Tistrella mobilis]